MKITNFRNLKTAIINSEVIDGKVYNTTVSTAEVDYTYTFLGFTIKTVPREIIRRNQYSWKFTDTGETASEWLIEVAELKFRADNAK